MCLMITYIISLPVIYFLMHFLQYPGNMQGDFYITGSAPSDYVAARSDGKLMRGLKVLVPRKPNSSQAPVVFFGGNAQGMAGAAQDAIFLLGEMYNKVSSTFQFQLYTTAYRGYEPNSGYVTQRGLTKDASDFLDHALNSTYGSVDGRVILGGWSMGAGVALQLAAARPENIAGVIVFSPWSTMHTEVLNIAAPLSYLLYPYIWMSYVWDSLAAISSLPEDIPVAVVSASADKVIHSWEHELVFNASKASRKWWLPVPGAQHNFLLAEVRYHKRELGKWMQSAWDRVKGFNTTTWDGKPGEYEVGRSGKPLMFLGEAVAAMHDLFII